MNCINHIYKESEKDKIKNTIPISIGSTELIMVIMDDDIYTFRYLLRKSLKYKTAKESVLFTDFIDVVRLAILEQSVNILEFIFKSDKVPKIYVDAYMAYNRKAVFDTILMPHKNFFKIEEILQHYKIYHNILVPDEFYDMLLEDLEDLNYVSKYTRKES